MLRLFRIHQRADGLFEIRNEFPKAGPLGIDPNIEKAIETAHREAMIASQEGLLVVIEAQMDGRWVEVDRVEAATRSA
jgi:hypothetical protein